MRYNSFLKSKLVKLCQERNIELTNNEKKTDLVEILKNYDLNVSEKGVSEENSGKSSISPAGSDSAASSDSSQDDDTNELVRAESATTIATEVAENDTPEDVPNNPHTRSQLEVDVVVDSEETNGHRIDLLKETQTEPQPHLDMSSFLKMFQDNLTQFTTTFNEEFGKLGETIASCFEDQQLHNATLNEELEKRLDTMKTTLANSQKQTSDGVISKVAKEMESLRTVFQDGIQSLVQLQDSHHQEHKEAIEIFGSQLMHKVHETMLLQANQSHHLSLGMNCMFRAIQGLEERLDIIAMKNMNSIPSPPHKRPRPDDEEEIDSNEVVEPTPAEVERQRFERKHKRLFKKMRTYVESELPYFPDSKELFNYHSDEAEL